MATVWRRMGDFTMSAPTEEEWQIFSINERIEAQLRMDKEQWRREQRYRFAGLVMQVLVTEAAGHDGTPSPSTIAKLSIAFSDALILELEKPQDAKDE